MIHVERSDSLAVLQQPVREQIYEHIRDHPGATYTEIQRSLALSKGRLTHHLQVLQRKELVLTRNGSGRKELYAAEACPPESGNGRASTQERLLRAIARNPGAAISELAGTIGISRQLAMHHARLLAQASLVRLERREERLCATPLRDPPRPM